MIDQELLSILACPDTHQSLSEADDALLAKTNERIAAGTAKNVNGETVTEKIDGGLLREDGKRLYPVRDGIPVLLSGEGLDLEG